MESGHLPYEPCKAKSKQSGQRCKNYPVAGKGVCRFHGGMSTGAKTEEGRKRISQAKFKHGRYTKEEKAARREARHLINVLRELREC